MKKKLYASEAAKICKTPPSTFLRWCQLGYVTDCELVSIEGQKRYVICSSFKIILPYSAEVLKRAVAK